MSLKVSDERSLALLTSRSWFHLSSLEPSMLIGKDLVFRLFTVHRPHGEMTTATTTGAVLLEAPVNGEMCAGTVEHSMRDSARSPVISYLERHGAVVEPRLELKQPGRYNPGQNSIAYAGKQCELCTSIRRLQSYSRG